MESTEQKKVGLPPAQDDEYLEIAWGIFEAKGVHMPMKIPRGKVTHYMIKLEIYYCGICHSDAHWGQDDVLTAMVTFPLVAGHEIVGKVVEVGAKVTKAKVGDNVGVGCMVDSCNICEWCKDNQE